MVSILWSDSPEKELQLVPWPARGAAVAEHSQLVRTRARRPNAGLVSCNSFIPKNVSYYRSSMGHTIKGWRFYGFSITFALRYIIWPVCGFELCGFITKSRGSWRFDGVCRASNLIFKLNLRRRQRWALSWQWTSRPITDNWKVFTSFSI